MNYENKNANFRHFCSTLDYLEDEEEDLDLLDPVLFLATSMPSTSGKNSDTITIKAKRTAQQRNNRVIFFPSLACLYLLPMFFITLKFYGEIIPA